MIRLLIALVVTAAFGASSQLPPQVPSDKPAAVEKLNATTYRVGRMRVDTAKREVSIPGHLNTVSTLEFVANTAGGPKAYESALTLDTNAISFNAAMLLIGLDPARARPSAMQFDSTPPQGDPVELTVEWQVYGNTRRIKVEELLYDQRTKTTLREGPWVYTGSTFIDTGDGTGKKFLAELDGVLIGFMHGPQAIIDNPRNDALGGYGSVILNPKLGMPENSPLSLTVKALPLDRK